MTAADGRVLSERDPERARGIASIRAGHTENGTPSLAAREGERERSRTSRRFERLALWFASAARCWVRGFVVNVRI